MKETIQKYIWPISVLAGIIIAYGIGYPSVYIFEEYGWTVFTVVPFFLGMIPPIIYGSTKELSKGESIRIGFSALGIFCPTTLLFALEGVICIIMASPIMVLSTLVGSLAGYYFVKHKKIEPKQFYSFVFLPIIFLAVDTGRKFKAVNLRPALRKLRSTPRSEPFGRSVLSGEVFFNRLTKLIASLLTHS
jgi:hypothetical protein